jgi:4-hydroxyphenylpyruvate dioxygenase
VAYAGLETGSREQASYVLQQDRIRLVLTSALSPGGPINAFVDRHGDGVRDVALMTDDARAAFEVTTRNGAKGVQEPRVLRDEGGEVVVATIEAYDDVRHTFVQRGSYRGAFLPGYGLPAGSVLESAPVGLRYVDHTVNNLPEGRMQQQVDWYQRVFGFHRFWSADDADIRTDYSSLRSVVVADDSERVKFPLNEPAPGVRKSQIEEFLDYNVDGGVQHVALLTNDIIATVEKLRENGVEFLDVPDSYYDGLQKRVGAVTEPMEALRRNRIMVDADDKGYLLQLFSKPVQDRPTLFFEVIQRKGSESFGKGNFKALFEAIEREQARRGNL